MRLSDSPPHASVARTNDRLGAASHLELGEDVGDMVAHRLGAERQFFGDGGVGVALRDELEHLTFALCQLGEERRLLGWWLAEILDQPLRHRRAEDRLTLAHRANCPNR